MLKGKVRWKEEKSKLDKENEVEAGDGVFPPFG